jgi:hypothetical protein
MEPSDGGKHPAGSQKDRRRNTVYIFVWELHILGKNENLGKIMKFVPKATFFVPKAMFFVLKAMFLY